MKKLTRATKDLKEAERIPKKIKAEAAAIRERAKAAATQAKADEAIVMKNVD